MVRGAREHRRVESDPLVHQGVEERVAHHVARRAKADGAAVDHRGDGVGACTYVRRDVGAGQERQIVAVRKGVVLDLDAFTTGERTDGLGAPRSGQVAPDREHCQWNVELAHERRDSLQSDVVNGMGCRVLADGQPMNGAVTADLVEIDRHRPEARHG